MSSSTNTFNNTLQGPSTHAGLSHQQLQQRRMTLPAGIPRSSLTLPDGATSSPTSVRPPSPLRNTFIPDSFTGIDPDDVSDNESDDSNDINNSNTDDQNKRNNNNDPYRSPSPASSVSQLATSIAQRVGSFVTGASRGIPSTTGSSHLPTDAELEAEAQRERDRSRKEAERILTREAEERRMADERLLGMKDMGDSLPPPPSRTQTMSNASSPSSSPKDKESSSWWTAAKNRLTPTKEKEPLTPAQQVILDAKAREKEIEKDKKKIKGKEKENSKEWPTDTQAKYGDPALSNLNVPPGPQRRPVPTSPVSPTPSRTNMAPNLTPSPRRGDSAPSPSREATPLYAQFTTQGTLDVHGTLLTIVRRFEKLEKWTVGHVRALEERMSDVERWLVDKEKEKDERNPKDSESANAGSGTPDASRDLSEIREEITELQGRVGELGREMARMANPGHSRQSPSVTSSVILPPSNLSSAFTTPHHSRLVSSTARDSTSPPIASSKPSSGTRLPYPAGDYASPPDNVLSPPHSPPSSINSATRSRPMPIPTPNPGSGLPSSTSLSTSYSSASYSSISSLSSRPLPTSPRSSSVFSSSQASVHAVARTVSPTPMVPAQQAQIMSTLPPPKVSSLTSLSSSGSGGKRQSSVSPTPRKRYTVALGEPIVPRDTPDHSPPSTPGPSGPSGRRPGHSRNQSLVGTAIFGSEKHEQESSKEENEKEESDVFQDETIGKSAALRMVGGSGLGGEHSNASSASPSPASKRRIRAQSAYDFTAFLNSQQLQPQSSQQSLQSMTSQSSQGMVAPLKPRMLRSRSTDRFGSNGRRGTTGGSADSGSAAATGSSGGVGPGGSKFVDPLVLRKQERVLTKMAMPKPVGKVPIGQLVAFFDGDKKDKS
ncbi:hypothetical protein AMATHDRAFT_67427 [Amanita thiersii Skay4041]|uniref:Uncharacterized protein n=1 Tax=Amanita thiersii Skay4041 TaxID=703135 RepID=A0A2A9NE54_9AGAR|nr:hypothetical protein AMATHDRAFT_67427 [Amanita thiersii Skay4041]